MTERITRISFIALAASLGALMLFTMMRPAGAQGGPVTVSFPEPGVTLMSGDTVTIEISASGLQPGGADTVQIGLEHGAGDLEVTGFRCAGIYGGAAATELIDVTPGESVAFTCSDQGAPTAAEGVVAEIDLTRSGSGDTELSFLTSGPYRTAFISGGSELSLTVANTLRVSDVLWQPAGFYFNPSELDLADGETADIFVYSGQVDIASASVAQMAITHDDSIIAINNVACGGLYSGGAVSGPVRVESDTASAFACSLDGGPQAEFGMVAVVTIERVGSGDVELEFLGTGPFRTAFIENGLEVSQGALGTMTVTDPNGDVTPTPSPSPSPTAIATTPSGGGGGGSGSNPQSTNTPVPSGPSVPSAPVNVLVAPGDGSVEITWESPASNGGAPIASYRIVNLNDASVATILAPANSRVISGLTNGIEYTFQVQAVNIAGPGASVVTGPVTPAAVPGAPTGAQATLSDSEVIVTWTAPASNGGSPITGYVVELTDGTEVASTTGDTQAIVTGLAPGSTYSFVVRAVNAVGESDASNTTGPVTVPSTSGSPGDAPGASIGQSVGTNSAISSAAAATFGSGVSAPNSPIVIADDGSGLKASISLTGLSGSASGPAQFNVTSDQLIIETDSSGNGTMSAEIGVGLKLTGLASVSVSPSGLSVAISDAKLAYAPAVTGDSGALSGVNFTVGLNMLPADSGLTVAYSTTLPSELAGATFALGSSAAGQLDDPLTDIGAVVSVTKTGFGGSDLGDNTVVMTVSAAWHDARVAQGKEIIITKVSDEGDVFAESAACEPERGSYVCVATFTGDAGGFSEFSLLAVTHMATPDSTPAPTPTLAPTSTSMPTATSTPAATATEQSLTPEPTASVAPSPQPEPTIALGGGDGSNSGSGGFPIWGWFVVAIGVIALARAGFYLASRGRS